MEALAMEAGLSFEPFAVDGEKEGDLHCSAAGASQQHHPRAELPFAAGSFYTGAEEASGGGEGAAAGAAAGAADAPGPAVGVAPDDTAAAAPPQPPAAPAALPAYADPSMPLGQAIVAMLKEVYQHLVTHGRRMAVGFGPKAVAPANPAPGTATRPRPYQGLTTELHRLVAAGRLKKAGVQGRKENPSRKGPFPSGYYVP